MYNELLDLLIFVVGFERFISIDKKLFVVKEFTTNINKQIAKKITSAFGKDIIKDINMLVERGSPVKIILNVAEERKCDLIVFGLKGKATLKNATIGSTVNKVLQRSKLPVLVIHNI